MGSVVISGATSGAITLAVPAEAGTHTVTIPSGTGQLLNSGDLSSAGDTAAGNAAAVGYTTAEGLILTGQGSTSDITFKNDADVTVFSIPTGTDDILFPDNAKAMFGAGSDLQSYHDGSNSYVKDNGTGVLYLQGADYVIIGSVSAGEMISGQSGAEVNIKYNNSNKLVTTNTGVDVTGNVIATGTVEPAGDTAADDNAAIGYTAAEGLILTGQGSTSDVTIKNDADVTVLSVATGTGFVGIGTTAPTRALTVSTTASTDNNILLKSGAANAYLTFADTNTSDQTGLSVRIGSSGDSMVFNTGGTTERMRILAGGGITFNGDTAAANALDDYEEGTWTPIVQGSTSGARTAGSINKGYYVKIGNVITVSGTIHCEGTVTIAGNVIISGLPYQATGVTQGRSSGTTGTSGIFTCADDFSIKLLVDPNATFIYVVQAKEEDTIGYSHTPSVGAGIVYGFEVSYRTV